MVFVLVQAYLLDIMPPSSRLEDPIERSTTNEPRSQFVKNKFYGGYIRVRTY